MGRDWLVYPIEVLEYKTKQLNDYSFEDRMIARLDMERWIDSLSKEQQDIIEMIQDGLNQTEIGRAMGCSQMTISRKLFSIDSSYTMYFK